MGDSKRVRRFKVLADENRIRILELLMQGPLCVSDLVESLKAEQSLVSHHLRVLRDAGFVGAIRQGKHISYFLSEGVGVDRQRRRFDFGCCKIEF